MHAIDYSIAFFLSFIGCLICVPVVIWLAKKFKVIDWPIGERKIHKKPTPLLGGLAIFAVFNFIVAIFYFFSSNFQVIPFKNLLGIFISGLILMIGGWLDDKYKLKPKQAIVFPILAIVVIVISGIGIKWMRGPMGGFWFLDKYSIDIFWYHGLPYRLTIFSDLFTFFWLLGMTYTTKLLDGLDGLVSGITLIGAFFILLSCLSSEQPQPEVALLTVILMGCYLAFLIYNFHPAKIFLGEGGSTFSGFILGVLSIISGSKVAITIVLMGVPILDVLWTIIRRLIEHKNPFKTSDRKHLHHRLLDAGFSVRRAVIFLYCLAVILGSTAFFIQKLSRHYFSLIFVVIMVFFLVGGYIYKKQLEKAKNRP